MPSISIKDLFTLSGEADTKSTNALVKAIKEGATDGFDYLRFKSSIKSMRELDMTEMQSFKSAFTTAQTIGITKDKLVKSASYYKNILGKELEKFGGALKKQYKQRVTDGQEKAKQLEKKKVETANKIKALQKELDGYDSHISQLMKLAEKENEKIVAARKRFLEAHTEIKNSIEADIKLMQEYL